jgi:hypothetical protein
MQEFSGNISQVSAQLVAQLPITTARAISAVLVERFGAACAMHVAVEVHPAGRSVGVDLRFLAVDAFGDKVLAFDSRWTVGPRGVAKRQQVGA